VELVWPYGQEVNGKFLVQKMRSALDPARARIPSVKLGS
jgi:hypothetical protein